MNNSAQESLLFIEITFCIIFFLVRKIFKYFTDYSVKIECDLDCDTYCYIRKWDNKEIRRVRYPKPFYNEYVGYIEPFRNIE